MEDLDSWEKRGNCSIIRSRLDSNVISPLFFWSLLDFIHLADIESNFGNEAEANCLHQSVGRAQLLHSQIEAPGKKNHLREGGKNRQRNPLKRTNCVEESCARDDTAVRHVHQITKVQRR